MKNKNFWLNIGIIALIVWSTTPLKAEAQAASSLVNRDCQSATPGRNLDYILKKGDSSITLGREVLPLLAYLSYDYSLSGDYFIPVGNPVEVVCNLKANFQSLKLVFGVHSGNSFAQPNNKILFGVYLDGNLAGTKEVIVGPKQEWTLNLQGVKNVALRAECISGKCPGLYFAEMSLR
ncbi:hypothetical protein ACE1CI_04385 [Aerosakkonemataceae cyanobacterium BLCC-F50]|uniref:Uncharacterized protein n=1 Tax=Floridaenema flaviceps BLCC-F50 TaxID=3153642 RepID=A0ABV4XKC4_9CYAN